MKTLVAVAIVVAMLVPGVAFAGSSTDAALGLGAFAVFNQMISGTGVFGGFHPAPRPVVVAPPVRERVIVREYHPVYAPPPVYHVHPPVHYYAPPRRVFVIKEHGWRGHDRWGHDRHFEHRHHR